jgi:hypothetical protein
MYSSGSILAIRDRTTRRRRIANESSAEDSAEELRSSSRNTLSCSEAALTLPVELPSESVQQPRCHKVAQRVSVMPVQTVHVGRTVRGGHRATDNERDSFSSRQKEKNKNGS